MRSMRKANPLYDIGDEQRSGLLDMCNWLMAKHRTKRWTIVEIGTYVGESAAIFSGYFKKVYTIDPWEPTFMKSIASDKNVTIEDLADELRKNMKPNIKFLRQPSILAAQFFENKSVDVVYIDGWHRVIPAALDIVTWLPKIKVNGYIGGHDFSTMHMSEVIPAVRYTLSEPDAVFADSSWLKQISLNGMEI